MLKIYDADTALKTILHRQPPDELTITPALEESLAAIFGERLTPNQAVDRILKDVRSRGDAALLDWSARMDGNSSDSLRVPESEIQAALETLSGEQRLALEEAASRIRRFHERQPITSWMTQELGGTLGQLIRPIRRVGLYIPAGTAPLPSSVLMSAVPAQVAKVPEIVLAVPPQRKTGKIASVILAAAALLGIKEIYAIGGAQAIAALAYGSESIPAVDKIFGPGNLFVTLAKKAVFGVVGIDTLAGPTETVVVADERARPEWVAADLLAQAEHDVLAAAILITPSRRLAEAVQAEVAQQIESLSRAEIINASLGRRSGIVLTEDLDQAMLLANHYGPEHMCLSVADPWQWVSKVQSAGGVFVGEHSFEVLGDYTAGPSHVMPTGGSARYASPLNVLDFVHIISLIALDPQTAAQIGPFAATIARSEGLDAHARAAERRL
ncbi:MAG: histidinol dehydrogenase [Anaerolineaceae bacterium]|nr:histidinol dehydrogenase [Anaerolineaceae bacterium]